MVDGIARATIPERVAVRPRVVILGAGPTGIGAAWGFSRSDAFHVTVLERESTVGGTTRSFDVDGVPCDLGSHRLHPSTDPELLDVIRTVLGDDLLLRPRNGRIRLDGTWIRFPLRPFDVALNAPKRFLVEALRDAAVKPFRRRRGESFADVLHEGLGPAICERFYFPYARKMWGLEPSQLSGTQARKRVSAGSPAKLLGKMLSVVPGLRSPTAGRFFYPRGGFGRIVAALAEASRNPHAEIRTGCSPIAIHLRNGTSIVETAEDRIEAECVLSTIPIERLVGMLVPTAPASVIEAATRIRWRSLRVVWMTLPVDRYTPYDAHYFPELAIPIARLSEPKNYGDSTAPRGRTVLCAEIPYDAGDAIDRSDDDMIGRRVVDALEAAGLPRPPTPSGVRSVRVPHAYPIYTQTVESAFGTIDGWLNDMPGLLTVGRLGLLAHDNTHHALRMGLDAARCVRADGTIDREAWAGRREAFRAHVVED